MSSILPLRVCVCVCFKGPHSASVSSLTLPTEPPKGQGLWAELQSTGRACGEGNTTPCLPLGWIPAVKGRERTRVSFPRKTRGFHGSTNLSSLSHSIWVLGGKTPNPTWLQAPAAHQRRWAAAPVSSPSYSAGGLAEGSDPARITPTVSALFPCPAGERGALLGQTCWFVES